MAWLYIVVILSLFVTIIAYARSEAARARKLVKGILDRVQRIAEEAERHLRETEAGTVAARQEYQGDVCNARLRAVPVDEFKKHAAGLRVQALKDAGLLTLFDLQGWNTQRLMQLRGIGPDSGVRIANVVSELSQRTLAIEVPFPATPPYSPAARRLLTAIELRRRTEKTVRGVRPSVEELLKEITARRDDVYGRTSIGMWATHGGVRGDVAAATSEATELSQEFEEGGARFAALREWERQLAEVEAARASEVSPAILEADVRANRERYEGAYLMVSASSTSSGSPLPLLSRRTLSPEKPSPLLSVSSRPISTSVARGGACGPDLSDLPPDLPPALPTRSADVKRSQVACSLNPASSGLIGVARDAHSNSYCAYWVPAGTALSIQGVRISSGMFYVGSGLKSVCGEGVEPSLIDPNANIASIDGIADAIRSPHSVNPASTEPSDKSFEPKDGMRISDILLKARGSAVKAEELARRMAQSIEGYPKALRRAWAAEHQGHEDLARIFRTRAQELAAQVAPTGSPSCCVRYLDYWPSYDTCSALARGSYLQWLETGKCDPRADIGYVFLYFYGLERRVLWDAASDPRAKAEIPEIEREIRRLVSIYGSSGSFRTYASNLLDFIAASRDVGASYIGGEPPSATCNRGLSFEIRKGLGRFARNEQPVPSDWAFVWLTSDPTIRLRTPATRCPDHFARLFTVEYAKAFGDGLKLPVNKTRLKVAHHPASASFGHRNFSIELDLPDVSVLSAPVRKLQGVADVCSSGLDAYSRFLGRNPERGDTLEALVLLPPKVWPATVAGPLGTLREKSAEQVVVLPLSDLLRLLSSDVGISRATFVALSRALGSLGIGIDPDPRFGGALPGTEDGVALFSADGLAQDSEISTGFSSAGLLLHLASAVAGADGDFSEVEEALLLHHIENGLNLSAAERRRLAARLKLHRIKAPSYSGLKRNIDGLGDTARERLGDFLVLVVQTDGVIEKSEIRAMEKIWKLLGLDQAALYTKLHGAAASEPVAVRSASGERTVFAIPPPPSRSPAAGFADLDMTKIAKLKADSAEVSHMLGAIFEATEEHDSPAVREQPEEVSSERLLALDDQHADLLQVMMGRPEWTRAELEELCVDRALMVDGAIERINEAALDRLDQMLIEGTDPIEVRGELLMGCVV